MSVDGFFWTLALWFGLRQDSFQVEMQVSLVSGNIQFSQAVCQQISATLVTATDLTTILSASSSDMGNTFGTALPSAAPTASDFGTICTSGCDTQH